MRRRNLHEEEGCELGPDACRDAIDCLSPSNDLAVRTILLVAFKCSVNRGPFRDKDMHLQLILQNENMFEANEDEPSPKRPKCSETVARGQSFAARFKTVGRGSIRSIRDEFAEYWETLEEYVDRRELINAYLRAMGDISELKHVVGDGFLREVLDDNIERIRRRDLS